MINIIKRTPIHKGWSHDKKYYGEDIEGQKYLIRISPIESYNQRLKEFELMKTINKTPILMSRPLEFGINEEGVYSIQSWIDGMDADVVIPKLSNKQQYEYGLKAGMSLQMIHSIPSPISESWDTFFNRKIDKKRELYDASPIKHSNDYLFIDYIEQTRNLLKGRPRVYQHGDFHIKNMIVGNDDNLYIIDFDRHDIGDPWEEFNRIVWSAQASPYFATGIINGYFNNEVPIKFWQLLALYISNNTLSSIPWAIDYGEGEVEVMLNQADLVLDWYDNMTRTVPSWYLGLLSL